MKYTSLVIVLILIVTVGCEKKEPNIDAELGVVKKYAESGRPKAKGRSLVSLELQNPPKTVEEALQKIVATGSRKHEKYIYLIMLRLYRGHIEYAHQSYDIRKDDEIPNKEPSNIVVREFCRLAGIDTKMNEFISSAEVYDRVPKNKSLMEYQLLAKEYMETKQVIEELDRQLKE